MLRSILVFFTGYLLILPVLGMLTAPSYRTLILFSPPGGNIVLCTRHEELSTTIHRVAEEWNAALTLLGIKYLWPEAISLKFETGPYGSDCDVDVVFEDLPENLLATVVGNQERATILVKHINDEAVLTKVLRHEIIHVLGLADGNFTSKWSPFTATPIIKASFASEITSYDVYAIVSSIRYKQRGEVSPPPLIPYHAWNDFSLDFAATLLSLTFTRLFLKKASKTTPIQNNINGTVTVLTPRPHPLKCMKCLRNP